MAAVGKRGVEGWMVGITLSETLAQGQYARAYETIRASEGHWHKSRYDDTRGGRMHATKRFAENGPC